MTVALNPITCDDVLDSRDLEARIDWLESTDDEDLDDDEREELQALQELRAECSDEWLDGLALIRDSYFEEYARELADDIGAIPAGAGWPLTCIDWEQAARELQSDYSQVEFMGVTYWTRD